MDSSRQVNDNLCIPDIDDGAASGVSHPGGWTEVSFDFGHFYCYQDTGLG